MALTQYTAATDIIKTLGTNPEDRPTLTDDTFKAKFDENSENIKTFLNAMIAELASTANGKGASQIGIEDSGSKFTAATVEAALAESATLISTQTAESASGWISAGETWAYASATTFTISGDKTAKYQKGNKIKLTANGVVKYGYIISATYSSPNTTVTVVGDALTNFAFSLNYYSNVDNPYGFPHWFAWTPTLTWTTATPTISSTVARFTINGRTLIGSIAIQASDGKGATALTITLPAVPYASASSRPCTSFEQTSAGVIDPLAFIFSGDGLIRFNSLATLTNAAFNIISVNFTIEI